MFQREEMVVPEHQTGHVNLERSHSASLLDFVSWPQVGTGLLLQVQQHLLSDSALQMRPLGKWRFFLTFMENMWDSTKLIPLIQFDMLNVWLNLQGRNVWEEAALPLLVALRQQVGWPGGKPPWRSTCKDMRMVVVIIESVSQCFSMKSQGLPKLPFELLRACFWHMGVGELTPQD